MNISISKEIFIFLWASLIYYIAKKLDIMRWGEWEEDTYLQYNYPLWKLHERDYKKYKRKNNIEDDIDG